MTKVFSLVFAVLALVGCAPTTKINIPTIGTYESDKNVHVKYVRGTDGSLTIELTGDAATVIDARGQAADAILGASTSMLDVAGRLAIQAAAASAGVPALPVPAVRPVVPAVEPVPVKEDAPTGNTLPLDYTFPANDDKTVDPPSWED